MAKKAKKAKKAKSAVKKTAKKTRKVAKKRVSARHQVKRLDRIFEELALPKTGPAEETSFLRSVRISKVRNFTGFHAVCEIWS